MKEELCKPSAIVGMVILFCLFWGLALAIYPGWATVGEWLSSAVAAAWVQAFGSIAAILATAFGVWWQMDRQLSVAENIRKEDAKHKSSGMLKRSLFLLRKLRDVSVEIQNLHEAFLVQQKAHALIISENGAIPVSTFTDESGFLKEDLRLYGQLFDSVVFNFSDLPYWDIDDAELANDLISIRALAISCQLKLATNNGLFFEMLQAVIKNISAVEDKISISA